MKFLHLPITWIPPKVIQWLYGALSAIIILISFISFYRVLFVTAQSNDQCIWLDSSWLDSSKPKGVLIMTKVVPGGVTENAGIMNGDSLFAINGIYNLNSNKATDIINAIKSGEYAMYTIKRGAKVFTTPVMMVKTYNTYFIGLLLTSICFVVVGMLVVLRKPHGELQQWFGLYSMVTAIAFWFYSNDGWLYSYFNIPIIVVGIASFIISMLLPFQVYFYYQFPVKKKIDKSSIYRTYGIAIGVYLLIYILLNTSGQSDISKQFIRLLQITYTLYYPIGLTIFIHRFFNLPKDERKQFRGVVIANGICVILLTYLLAVTLTNSSAQFLNPYLLAPALLICLPPFALGYAIFRYGLMDVDIIIERSLIFTVVASIIALLYVGVIFATSEFMLGFVQGLTDVKVNNSLVTLIALCVITLLFDPIKRRVELSVERLLYQDRVNYQQALLALSKELPGMIRFDEITRTLSSRLSETMRVDSVKIMVSEDYYAHYEQHNGNVSQLNAKESFSSTNTMNNDGMTETKVEPDSKIPSVILPELEETSDSIFGALQATKNALRIEKKSAPNSNFEREMNSLAELGYQLAVPLLGSEVILGIIFCGKKLSGKAYSQDDVDLLSTVASQAAIAYENARLHTSEIERGKMQESLQVARRIQQNLLPTIMPTIEGVHISCASEQAEVVGGDFYDVVELADNSVLVAVGDVSGKGMSAALYMAQIQGMIRISASMHLSPKDMLVAVNKHLYERVDRQTYVTLCLVKINPSEKSMTVCRAGHTKPIICIDNQPAHQLESKGLGAGLTSNLRFAPTLQEVHIEWKETSTILLFSDGVNETPDIHGNELGVDRITRIVDEISQSNLNGSTAYTLQERIMQEVLNVRAGQQPFDDSTVVAVHCG